MKHAAALIAVMIAAIATPIGAIPLREPAPRYHWECVPYAREVSGVQIYGDAHTWWGQAEGRYARGNRPRIGAVLSFIPHGAMRLGHVATVSEIIDARTVRVTHANWSTINGRRGQVERGVEVIDVSLAGDWSKVRVWFAASEALGTTHWPTHGFIYPSSAPTYAPQGVPRLTYANVIDFTPKVARPTGRLGYLGGVLDRLDR
jgi:surface antigen